MRDFIAVDIGGTFIKYGLVSDEGIVLEKQETPTEAACGAEQLVHKVTGLIAALLAKNPNVAGIGISTAGIVDTKSGIILYANENLPGYTGTHLKEIIETQFKLPAAINNDVNAAALAEQWVGAGAGRKNFFCMALGTGIGGAIVLDGKLYKGTHFRAAEIGYFNKKRDEDYFEKRASTAALINMAAEELHTEEKLDGITIFSRAKAGAAAYVDIVDAWVGEISPGLANIICMFDPEVIIIGGGVSKQKDFLLKKIRASLPVYLPLPLLEGIELVTAECENDAGLIGAVYELANK